MTESTRQCSVNGCEHPYRAKGYCRIHYSRWLRNGHLKTLNTPVGTVRLCAHCKVVPVKKADVGRAYRKYCSERCRADAHSERQFKANLIPLTDGERAGIETRCTACNQAQPLDQFISKRDGTTCRTCLTCREDHSRIVTADPELNHKRRLRNLSKYGLTAEDFEQLTQEQDGLCAICRRVNLRLGKPVPLVVDHDHTTGAVRGLLCGRCNTGIGGLNDDPEIIKAALTYLLTSTEDSDNGVLDQHSA